MKIKIIRVSGEEEEYTVTRENVWSEIGRLINTKTLDSFILKDRTHICFVDDLGFQKMLQSNHKATLLYHEVCRPGTTHFIVGDVAIVNDNDFAGPDVDEDEDEEVRDARMGHP